MINRSLFLFLAFGCLGITTEIFFTALMDSIAAYSAGRPVDLGLGGHSYVWMFPIYGGGLLLFEKIFKKLQSYHSLLRVFLLACAIVVFEFFAGMLLDKLTGSCPWNYTEGYHIWGYARLDYLPFWMFFVFMMERVYLFLDELWSKTNGDLAN